MDFTGLRPVIETRPKKQRYDSVLWRDNFHVSTLLCIGAAVQSVAFLILGRLSLLPAAGILLYRIFDAYAMTTGLKRNKYMDNVTMAKFSAQFPDSQGHYGNKASNDDVAVLLIGTQSNHAMGLLGPGFKELGDRFNAMVSELEDNAVANGFLGSNAFMGTERGANNHLMNIMYFKSADHVHEFALGKTHRDTWDWWNKIQATHPHLAIYHELYHVPKGYWETIYVQSSPVGFSSTQHQVSQKDGTKVWQSPIVDASRGVLKSSAGRMGRNLSEKV